MLVIFKMACRHLMRHKYRTVLTGLIIAVGTAATVLAQSYAESSRRSLTSAIVESTAGRIQIRSQSKESIDILFGDSGEVPPMKQAGRIIQIIKGVTEVRDVTPRLTFRALLSDGRRSVGGLVYGIDPRRDSTVFTRLRVGGRPITLSNHGILLGKETAKTLNVRPGQELVLLTETPDGYINGISLRYEGTVFAQGMEGFVGDRIYIPIDAARRLLFQPADSASEVVVALKDPNNAEKPIAETIRRRLHDRGLNLRVDPWQSLADVFTGVIGMNSALPQTAVAIILLTVAIGIVTTVLTGVLERTRDIGTQMALGARPGEIIRQLMLETTILCTFAAGVGVLMAGAVIVWLGRVGIPAVMEALEFSFGGKRLYLGLDVWGYVLPYVGVVFLGALAALWPAANATRLKPAEALRSV